MNNSFGTIFRITTFGESHGPAIGVVIDGVPAGLPIDLQFIQSEMDRRRPGQSSVSTQRRETDTVEILSGVFQSVSTGTPIAMLIRNTDHHSADYSNLAEVFRPGHADFTFQKKYGIRDYRGGGRASGRETAARVAAGAIAKLILKQSCISVCAHAEQIGKVHAAKCLWNTVENNSVRCGDPDSAPAMEAEVHAAAAAGDSIGGTVYGEIRNLPAGLGEPVFDKFDACLASAIFSIGGVKGFEIGDGFRAADAFGSTNNDTMTPDGFLSNHAGGVLGGITNGETVTFRAAVKPTPSISLPQSTVNQSSAACTIEIKGRHDPCLVPRIVPVVEAMAAIVTCDLLLRTRQNRIAPDA